jgi:hypothetical protein
VDAATVPIIKTSQERVNGGQTGGTGEHQTSSAIAIPKPNRDEQRREECDGRRKCSGCRGAVRKRARLN